MHTYTVTQDYHQQHYQGMQLLGLIFPQPIMSTRYVNSWSCPAYMSLVVKVEMQRVLFLQ